MAGQHSTESISPKLSEVQLHLRCWGAPVAMSCRFGHDFRVVEWIETVKALKSVAPEERPFQTAAIFNVKLI